MTEMDFLEMRGHYEIARCMCRTDGKITVKEWDKSLSV